jgi:hypothetical protein
MPNEPHSHRRPYVTAPYDTYIPNPLVEQNAFLTMPSEDVEVPTFRASRHLLPEPSWQGHDAAIRCYWRTWELAFKNLKKLTPESGFIANFLDTAFNDCIFMWDSCFMLMFGRYGTRAFPFLRTLDNFYAKQHPDGFICREIGYEKGDDRFFRFDPVATGPAIMPWTEWEYYLNFSDKERLARVFPALVAFHQWMRAYRTWPDGSYWGTGWSTGMDNQPRMDISLPYTDERFSHQYMTWVDVCLQQLMCAHIIIDMAQELDREDDVKDMHDEVDFLSKFINEKLWDISTSYYFDRHRDGSLNGCKSIGAYWALLAGIVPQDQLTAFVAHLENPQEFNRPHRVPSLSADDPDYKPEGEYWKGSVWPPTNYMIMRGLTRCSYDGLAHEIALNHHQNVVDVFEDTGTLFENYAPESAARGSSSRKDFVGWGGLGPIAVLFEYVFGIRADVPNNRLVWDVRLLEAHGIDRYPFGADGTLNLQCAERQSTNERPQVTIKSNVTFELELRWNGGVEIAKVTATA